MDATIKPTAQGIKILEALIDTTSHLAIVARAGCGKTSMILMGVKAYSDEHPSHEILVCAFNKSIAREVGEKLQNAGFIDWRKVSAATIHSMGLGLVRFVFKLGPNAIDDKKVRKLIEKRNGWVYKQYGPQIEALVGYAKGAGVGFFNDVPIGNPGTWYELADHFDVNGLEDTSEMDAVVEAAQVIYRDSLDQTNVIDFDDMILWPLIKNLRVKFGKDLIFLDEAQDLSRTRQALAKKFLKPGGRMVVVGDDRQAIYGFAGADAAALPNLIQSLSATVLPLSVTWRCPKAVVREAQRLVPDIEAADVAPDGVVGHVVALPDKPEKTDAILCRNNAPLITIAYSLIRRGIPCKVEGRAIGEGLIKLAQRWKVADIDALLDKLDAYQDREMQKAFAKGNEAKAQEVADRVGTLKEVCDAVMKSGKHAVSDVVDFINNLFGDDVKGVTTLCTYHKAKGREWPRVYLWEHSSRCPSKAARQDWQLQQEDNLAYVAITRAQKELYYVN